MFFRVNIIIVASKFLYNLLPHYFFKLTTYFSPISVQTPRMLPLQVPCSSCFFLVKCIPLDIFKASIYLIRIPYFFNSLLTSHLSMSVAPGLSTPTSLHSPFSFLLFIFYGAYTVSTSTYLIYYFIT